MLRIKTIILRVISNSWFISFVVSGLIILLLPPMFNKYKSELLESGFINKVGGYEFWVDFNKDRNSERIILFNNTEGNASLKIMDQGRFIPGHYYFNGSMIHLRESFSSSSIDSSDRIYLFLLTIKDDSILFHAVDPNQPGKFLFKDKFLSKIRKTNGLYDLTLCGFQFSDLDGDGTKEVIFSLMAGFPLKPRKLYIYNIKKNSLTSSPDSGWYYGVSEIMGTKPGDKKIILMNSYAIKNYPDSVKSPRGDSSAWLFAYDRDLNYVFPPREFPGQYEELKTAFMFRDKTANILLLKNRRTRSAEYPTVSVCNLKGEILQSLILDDTSRLRLYSFYIDHQSNDQLYLIRENGQIELLDEHLKTEKKIKVVGLKVVSFISKDIDKDGKDELVFTDNSSLGPVIVRSDFTNPVSLPIPTYRSQEYFDIIEHIGESNKVFIQNENRYFICSYEKNPWFYLRWPFNIGIYFVVLLFIWLIRFIQRKALEEKYQAEKKISALQLLLLKNQIDPHFTFNAINAISASVLQGKPEEANNNIIRLSKLMRSSVEHGDRLSRTLSEELEFVKNYLDLLKSRMNPSFDYHIEIAEDVDLNCQVPKMITQIYVENAVKHGLRPLTGGGHLWIRVKKSDKNIRIEIEDNGVGRKKARSNGSSGTGKGMQIMDQFVETFNRYNTYKIRMEIIDKEDENYNSPGTKIILSIPTGMKYSLYEK